MTIWSRSILSSTESYFTRIYSKFGDQLYYRRGHNGNHMTSLSLCFWIVMWPVLWEIRIVVWGQTWVTGNGIILWPFDTSVWDGDDKFLTLWLGMWQCGELENSKIYIFIVKNIARCEPCCWIIHSARSEHPPSTQCGATQCECTAWANTDPPWDPTVRVTRWMPLTAPCNG